MKGLVLADNKISLQTDLNKPFPKSGEVLIKVKYASIHSFDVDTVNTKRSFLKFISGAKTYPVMTGIEFSGEVVSDGTYFKKGDEVYGYPDIVKGQKSHQEYLTIKEDLIALKPENIDLQTSSGIPVGALTSLVGIEKVGKIKQGSKILINGAAGGLGVYAVQISKILGAHVTAIAGPGQEEFLTKLGADKVLDYKQHKLQDINSSFDVIFDLSAKVKFKEVKKMLTQKGVFIPADPFSHIGPVIGNLFRRKKVGFLIVSKGEREGLSRIASWAEDGKLIPVIDRVYTFEDYQKGFDRTGEPGKKGRILMKIQE